MSWQIIEKGDFGVDWAQVRFSGKQSHLIGTKLESEEVAVKAAVDYITDLNCDNALTPDEKLNNLECFMVTAHGVYLGVLDGDPWYMKYPKDIVGKLEDGSTGVLHHKGETVQDKSFFLLEGKTEVAVRKIPGT